MASIKDRRKALGLSRAQLAAYAYVDARTAQLLEMGQADDAEATHRLEVTLTALESGQEPPAWKDQVEAEIERAGHQRIRPGGPEGEA